VLFLALVACGPGLKSADLRRDVRATLRTSLDDVQQMTKLLRAPVVNGGVWFDDPKCAAQFAGGEIAPALLPSFARCLVDLHLEVSTREDALGDVYVLDYAPGFELEARVTNDTDGPRLAWIGFASKRTVDTLPTISGAALEALRIAGDRGGPIDAQLGSTLKGATLQRAQVGSRPVDPKAEFVFAWLKVCLDTTGAVTSIDPFMTTSTDAQKAFVSAAQAWKFRPFTVRGTPMPVCAMTQVAFPPNAGPPEVLPLPPPPSHNKKWPVVLPTSKLLEGKRISGVIAIVPNDIDRTRMARARIERIEGTFRLCLDEAGDPESVLPVRSTGLPGYDEKIVSAMRQWKYRPYQIDDQTVPVCTYVTFLYSQDPRSAPRIMRH
jgi:hypothetical protein